MNCQPLSSRFLLSLSLAFELLNSAVLEPCPLQTLSQLHPGDFLFPTLDFHFCFLKMMQMPFQGLSRRLCPTNPAGATESSCEWGPAVFSLNVP